MKYVMLIVDKPGFWETLPEEKRNETQLQPANTATTVQVQGVLKSWPGDAKLELRPIVEIASVDNVPSAPATARASR